MAVLIGGTGTGGQLVGQSALIGAQVLIQPSWALPQPFTPSRLILPDSPATTGPAIVMYLVAR